MAAYLDKQSARRLLRNPATKVLRNPTGSTVWGVMLVLVIGGLLAMGFLSYASDWWWVAAELAWLGLGVAGILWESSRVVAFTEEGMYLSLVETEDYRGPLSKRRLYVHWDELTELKLSYGPVLSFRVRGQKYGFSVDNTLMGSGRSRAKQNLRLVEAVSSYSGCRYHFSKGEWHAWEYVFVLPNRAANAIADAYDWERLGN